MKLLSVDASGKSAAVAVTEDGKLIAEQFVKNGFTHSETLLPLVDTTLRQAGLSIEDIDEFAVTNGPGSFTGLRIGCAMIKGLAADKPCRPVPTLLALAYNCIEQNGIVIPMMDARCHQTYTATFEIKNKTVVRLCEDRAIAVEQLEKEIENYILDHKTVIVPGDGAYLLRPTVSESVILPKTPLIIGQSVAKAAQDIPSVPAEELSLRYLRLSQAERERNMKLGGKKS